MPPVTRGNRRSMFTKGEMCWQQGLLEHPQRSPVEAEHRLPFEWLSTSLHRCEVRVPALKKNVVLLLAVAIAILTQSFPALSQQTAFGHIIALQTGSLGGPPSPSTLPHPIDADDTVSVTLDVPFINASVPNSRVPTRNRLPSTPTPPPGLCKIVTGGYALDPKDTGTKLNESVLLSAYLAGKKVSLQLNGCVFDKPRIVSVSLSASSN
jgi:hypothetical protein